MRTYENLKLLMTVYGISVIDLAKMTGKTRQTIANYLAGSTTPDAEWICFMADYFNKSTECILDRVDLILTEIPKAGGQE